MAKNLCSVIWQFHDQRRRVSHTVRAWKTGRNFDLVFLSYRTPKIPLSLNRPVSRGSKIVGKTEREKKGECSNYD